MPVRMAFRLPPIFNLLSSIFYQLPAKCFARYCHSGCACCVNGPALLTSLQSLLSHSSSDFLLLEVKGGGGRGEGRGREKDGEEGRVDERRGGMVESTR